jgi:hypothetical protein
MQEMAQEIAMIDKAVERARSSNKAASRRGVPTDSKTPKGGPRAGWRNVGHVPMSLIRWKVAAASSSSSLIANT